MGYINRSPDAPPRDDQFADHFEWDGTRWLYYRRGWMAPVPLSDSEYEQALRFYRKARWAGPALIFAMIAIIILNRTAFSRIVDLGSAGSLGPSTFGLIVGWFTSYLIANLIAEPFATRGFAKRVPVGPPRDRAALLEDRLALTGWISLAGSVLLAFGAIYLGWRLKFGWPYFVLILGFISPIVRDLAIKSRLYNRLTRRPN